MDPVVILEGQALATFLDLMEQVRATDSVGPTPVYALSFSIDEIDGGLKVKVNGYSWAPAIGRIDRPLLTTDGRCGCIDE